MEGGSLASAKLGRNIRRFTMAAPWNDRDISVHKMQRGPTGFRSLSLFSVTAEYLFFYLRAGAPLTEGGARETAKASRPSWRFRLRRTPAASSSSPAMARITHAEDIFPASASNSLARCGFLSKGLFTPEVSSRRSDSSP